MSEHSSSGAETLLAFLVGGAVGAVAALLLAPATGRETRERLSDWTENARHKGEKFLREKRDHLAEKVEEHKDRLGTAFEAGKKAYRDVS